jgi:lipopolysaccharide transport system ATP-binding protein
VNWVIKVQGLSKNYIIGHQRQEYMTLRDTMTQKFREVGKRVLHPFLSSSGQPLISLTNTEEVWALKDVSFEIKQGDRVGIIGRNGAGKTTMLKILSRITEPSRGWLKIKGRVASLLEVGTGFHPELTGRENIFLNGAVLGMTRAEIKEKFDEIVAFAEVEKFSLGMFNFRRSASEN